LERAVSGKPVWLELSLLWVVVLTRPTDGSRWMGSQIIRFDRLGKPTFHIDIPSARNVTACEFGGKLET